MIEKSVLISKVAEKHNVIISEDDPLIAMHCMLDIFLDEYGLRMKESLEKSQEEVIRASIQAVHKVEQNSEKVAIKSLACFNKIMADGADEFKKIFDGFTEELRSSVEMPDVKDDALRGMIPLTCNILFFLMNIFFALKTSGILR